jgi:hypothetical protein
MPYEYFRDDARRRVRVNVYSPITDDEMIAIVDRRAAEGVWAYGVLVDTRGAERPPDDMSVMIARVSAISARQGLSGPVAIVARSAPFVSAGTVFAHRSNGTSQGTEVFWDYDEADRWLEAVTS